MPNANPPFALQLEQFLGDPFDPRTAISFDRIVQIDEREEFPAAFIAALRQAGADRYLVPREMGGSLASFEESALVLRLIARRDLTAAIAFGQTFLGSIPVWLSGTEAQKQALAASIRAGDLGCLALTEEPHGGDLTACDFQAVPQDGHYLLSGKKWLINNGSNGGFATVFARTSGQAALSSYSLLFLDRSRFNPGATYRTLGKIRTHGIRGADISGFECADLSVAGSALLGAAGRGYEITLKTLQISRTMCAALSMGAADTALRIALDFALHRRVFGDTVANIPSARAQLAGGYADLLICECLSQAVSRAIQVCPERLPVWSSVVKYLAPLLAEDLIGEAAIVLGARHYLREGFHSGVFQKVMRDNAVVGLFDGSSAVNLHIVSGQLPALVAKRGASPDRRQKLARLFEFTADVPWAAFPRDSDLRFTNEGYDEIVDGLRLFDASGLSPRLAALIDAIRAELLALERAVDSLDGPRDRRANSAQRFALARRYCFLLAASSCLQVWDHQRGYVGDDWLVATLQRMLARLSGASFEPPDAIFDRMAEQHQRNELFSLRRFELGR